MKALLLCLALLALLLASGLALSYSKHQARRAFTEITALQEQRQRLEQDWKRLKLEQSKLSSLALINDKAVRQLGMVPPEPGSVVYIQQ